MRTMSIRIVSMDSEHASEILGWHYPGHLSFYDLGNDPEDIREILDHRRYGVNLFSAVDEQGELIGELTLNQSGDEMEMGVGLRPDLVGKGLGKELMEKGMEFARNMSRFDRFTIRVWKLNGRAIRLYQEAGFEIEKEYLNFIEGIPFRFLLMSRGR
jgi:ribosomal-protein-alanine N-acetyltransferase